MLLLKDLFFIDIKPGKSGDISHVLIWNPHQIIRMHQQRKTSGLSEGAFNALLERALDIGAKDMLEPLPFAPAPPEPSATVVPLTESAHSSPS